MPLVVSAPMLGAATPALAVSVSRAGGIGFLAAGTSATQLDGTLEEANSIIQSTVPKLGTCSNRLPIGISFQNWACDLNFAIGR